MGGRRTLVWKVSRMWFRRTYTQMEGGCRERGLGGENVEE